MFLTMPFNPILLVIIFIGVIVVMALTLFYGRKVARRWKEVNDEIDREQAAEREGR